MRCIDQADMGVHRYECSFGHIFDADQPGYKNTYLAHYGGDRSTRIEQAAQCPECGELEITEPMLRAEIAALTLDYESRGAISVVHIEGRARGVVVSHTTICAVEGSAEATKRHIARKLITLRSEILS